MEKVLVMDEHNYDDNFRRNMQGIHKRNYIC